MAPTRTGERRNGQPIAVRITTIGSAPAGGCRVPVDPEPEAQGLGAQQAEDGQAHRRGDQMAADHIARLGQGALGQGEDEHAAGAEGRDQQGRVQAGRQLGEQEDDDKPAQPGDARGRPSPAKTSEQGPRPRRARRGLGRS
jgi:hypothetical protein